MGRRNQRGGRPQARRRGPGEIKPKFPQSFVHPVPVERMVVPVGRCGPRKKSRFATEKDAAEALRQARATRRINGNPHAEERYYKCDRPGCGGWHLTSMKEKPNGKTNR